MKRRLINWSWGGGAALALLLVCGSPAAAQTFDVYYLSVGSSDYAQVSPADAARGLRGFRNLRSANKSAVRVAGLLQDAGSPFGITITSDPSHPIRKSDVLRGLDSLMSTAKRARSGRPLLFVYLAGHGVSEGLGWNHFTIPGDFTYRSPISRTPILELGARTVYAAEVVDTLEWSKIPFVLLLDNCTEGEQENFSVGVLTAEAARNANDVMATVRFMNEFHGANPVVFSSRPGTTVDAVRDPLDASSQVLVAPLSRRLMMMYDRALRSHQSMTLRTFVNTLVSPTFDQVAKAGITVWDGSLAGTLVPSNPLSRGRHVRLLGSTLR
jgi:hypothetical protein